MCLKLEEDKISKIQFPQNVVLSYENILINFDPKVFRPSHRLRNKILFCPKSKIFSLWTKYYTNVTLGFIDKIFHRQFRTDEAYCGYMWTFYYEFLE